MKKTKSTADSASLSLSIWIVYGWGLVLLLLGVIFVVLPIFNFFDLAAEISNRAEVVTLKKGTYYLFGFGISFLVMVIWPIYQKLTRPLSPRAEKLMVLGMVGGLILGFMLPQVVHSGVERNLTQRGYQICEAQSTRWLHVVTIVYTKTVPCEEPAPASSHRSTKH